MTVAQVRLLSSDQPLYDRALAEGDGETKEFQTGNYPVIDGTAQVYIEGVLQVAGVDYTLDLEVGLVSFTAAPTNLDGIVITYRHALLSDTNIGDLLLLYPNVRRAAAAALDIIATNEALVQKKMRLLDVQTDGPAVAKSLRDHAAQLRKQADEEEAAEDAGFDIAEMVFDDFSYRERLYKQAQREQL